MNIYFKDTSSLSHNIFFSGDYLGIRENAETAILGASLRLGELELKEEWQDEEFPR